MKRKTGTFEEFKDYTLAVARGERQVDPSEPKVWIERINGERGEKGPRPNREKQGGQARGR